MIIYDFDGGRVILRPSGTEPKLKCYLSCRGTDDRTAEAELEALEKDAFKVLGELTK